MSCNCCSFVVVRAHVLADQARACLQDVDTEMKRIQRELNDQAAAAIIRRKNRWYYFGRNKNYVPTPEEIACERKRDYPWYSVWSGMSMYDRNNLTLRCKKETAERLLAAANMGEAVSVATEDIRTIS